MYGIDPLGPELAPSPRPKGERWPRSGIFSIFSSISSILSIFLTISNSFCRPKEQSEVNLVHKPHPMRHIRKTDFSHTWKGTIAGLIIMGAAVINLVLFFGFDG